MITRTRYKEKIDSNAVAMDLEIEVRNEVRKYFLGIDIEYVPNKEIALFIFGRRGEGRVDPQIIDNINYYKKIKIPEYKSFMAGNRKKSIGITSSLYHNITSSNPIKNLLGDPNDFSHKDSVSSDGREHKQYTADCVHTHALMTAMFVANDHNNNEWGPGRIPKEAQMLTLHLPYGL